MKVRFLALAALVLGLASCQQDVELNNPVVGGEVDFQLKVDAKELATRADGDEQNGHNSAYGAIDYLTTAEWDDVDLRYTLEVYDADANFDDATLAPVKDRIVKYVDSYEPVKFDLRLIPNRKYRFVVFADFVSDDNHTELYHHLGETLANIDIVDAGINNELTDSYFAIEEFEINNSAAKSIELKRPYGKVRVIATDLAELNLNVDPASVVVTYDATHPTTFNAVTGAIGAVETKDYVVSYNYADGLSKSDLSRHYYTQGLDAEVVNGRHTNMTLFTDYILATNEQSPIHFTVDVKDGNRETIKATTFDTEIPVQRNHLTTIIGNVLTTATEVNVTIDDNFAQPEYIVEVWDGETVTEPTTPAFDENGDVIENSLAISQPSELAWLAGFVNGTFAQTTATRADEKPIHFVLTSDIDLNNMPWTPIGYNPNDVAGNESYFTGTFDGNGHEIHNLFIDVKDQGGVGLFGAVHNATIKNLTLCNVYVKAVESEDDPANASGAEGKANYIAGGHIGAVAGYDVANGTVVFDNVHVKGLIQIEGETRAAQGQRVGGIIGGRASSKYTFNNVSVIGDKGSYIKGYCSTAGVIGHNQEAATFENVNTNINVYAVTFGAGGIAGIACQGSTFTNCSAAGNITLDASKTQLSSYSANYPYRVGGIAGCWSDSKSGVLTLTNCSYDGTLTSIDKDGNSPEAFDYAGYVGRGYTLKNCAGSKVIVNGDEYVQVYNTTYGVYYLNGAYEVNTAADLKALANDVNSGADYFEGKNVVLTANIDLNNEEWTPIGSAYKDHGFMGNFDGKNFAIKNLNITDIAVDSDGYAYAGLFGVTEGTEEKHNYIKNLTIENVNIETTGHIVAAAIAYPYYTDLENISVKGNVAIKGGDYTSGVLAYTRRCVNAKNIAIEANKGSIEGNKTVGGVISDIQLNGGLVAAYSNFEASSLTVKGAMHVGGISGIISKQTLNGATVKNVTIVCDDARKGQVSGSLGENSVITGVSVENVAGATNLVGATFSEGKNSTVTIDGVVYEYLENGSLMIDGKTVVASGVLVDAEGTYYISNKAGMFWFANEVNANKNAFNGKSVKLTADINLNNEAWTPVGQTGATTFNGVFDGQNYTISNLNVDSVAQKGAYYSSGLFGWVETHTEGRGIIKNVKINGATVKGNHNCGALVGYITEKYARVENCHVANTAIECHYANGDADGDKAGALIGNATNATKVNGCTATDCTVSAGRDAGQLIGAAKLDNVTNCSATNVAVSANGEGTGKNIRNEVVGRVL